VRLSFPPEDQFNTFEVTSGDVRYDDDSCDGGPARPAAMANRGSLLHGDDVISGI
jgi:hypothetical protein